MEGPDVEVDVDMECSSTDISVEHFEQVYTYNVLFYSLHPGFSEIHLPMLYFTVLEL